MRSKRLQPIEKPMIFSLKSEAIDRQSYTSYYLYINEDSKDERCGGKFYNFLSLQHNNKIDYVDNPFSICVLAVWLEVRSR